MSNPLSLESLDKLEHNLFEMMSNGLTSIDEYKVISKDLSDYLRSITLNPGAYKNSVVEEQVKLKLTEIWIFVEAHISELKAAG